MEWFEGSIVEAIQRAKTNKSVFIVYVYDDSDASREMTTTWNATDIGQMSASSECVAIKLDASSEPGRQFSQIYPVMCVPSVFFINGSNGIPLEVCGGALPPAQLGDKFNHALQLHATQTSATTTSTSEVAAATSAPVPVTTAISSSFASAAVKTAATDKGLMDEGEGVGAVRGADCAHAEIGAEGAEACGVACEGMEQDANVEEKKAKAAALLAERREKKLAELKEKEKQEEVERRKVGQDLTKFKNWKEEMEKKEIETSLRKDKEEAKRAREKVRADLERDRQERAARFQKEKADQETATRTRQEEKAAAEQERQSLRNAEKRETARIQFRLPDGSSVTQVFLSSDHLSTARTFIQQKINASAVMLVCTFPKRTYTEADMSSTLLDLDLVPSAALIVLLTTRKDLSSPPTGGGAVGDMISYVLGVLTAAWLFIVSFFLRAPSSPSVQASDDARSEPPPTQSSDVRGESNETRARQRAKGSGKTSKQDSGNIHRLNFNDNNSDSDDENATWNGNSTQQM